MLVAVVDADHAFAGTHHVEQTDLVERVPQLEDGGGWAMVFSPGVERRGHPQAHRRDGLDRRPARARHRPDHAERATDGRLTPRVPVSRRHASRHTDNSRERQSLMSQMTVPDVTTAPTSAARPVTVPALWALSGCSIFIASSTTIV